VDVLGSNSGLSIIVARDGSSCPTRFGNRIAKYSRTEGEPGPGAYLQPHYQIVDFECGCNTDILRERGPVCGLISGAGREIELN
jgi:hypothetical protein